MDEIALRYLLLGLRLGRHVPGLVRSYHGPAALSEAVDGEPPTPPAELHDEAMQIAGLAADLPGEPPAQRRRATWITAQATAMGALARQAGGEEIGYLDLVEELYDVEVQLEPDATFQTAAAMLEAVVPGSGSLRERLASHDADRRVPPERVLGMATELATRLRVRTRAQLWLPERESMRIEAVDGVARRLEGRYLGSGNSVIRVNLDRPVTLATLLEIGAHHGYPGHHAEASSKDELLASDEHAELSLIMALTPQMLVSEGIAAIGREVVMSDQELGTELQRLMRPIDPGPNLGAELPVQRARRLLLPALCNAAVALHRDGVPAEDVRSYLAEVGLLGDERLDETMRELGHVVRSTRFFAHVEGQRLVSEWLEVHGQTHGLGRLLTEEQTPSTLRSELRTA